MKDFPVGAGCDRQAGISRVSIARVWHGITREADAERYLHHIHTKGIPAYRAVEGNRGAFALSRVANGVAEYLVISFWDSITAIQRYVGDEDITKAVYYPEDHQYLGFPEQKVTHYELTAGDSLFHFSHRLQEKPFADTT